MYSATSWPSRKFSSFLSRLGVLQHVRLMCSHSYTYTCKYMHTHTLGLIHPSTLYGKSNCDISTTTHNISTFKNAFCCVKNVSKQNPDVVSTGRLFKNDQHWKNRASGKSQQQLQCFERLKVNPLLCCHKHSLFRFKLGRKVDVLGMGIV